jgi:hypothetical protein
LLRADRRDISDLNPTMTISCLPFAGEAGPPFGSTSRHLSLGEHYFILD